uniref:Secreted protein n=1 Tax=Apteryx owenii TaxID=8824 RepID=A0A8B9NY11_APTOW
MYWSLSVLLSATGLGGLGGRVSMVVCASSTDECPLRVLTWIFLWSRCLAKLLREALTLTGNPAFWFSKGIRLVSRVLSFGWKYFRAWKSLWMACPTTILSFKIFRIWKCQMGLDRCPGEGSSAPCQEASLLEQTRGLAPHSPPPPKRPGLVHPTAEPSRPPTTGGGSPGGRQGAGKGGKLSPLGPAPCPPHY